MAFREFKRRLAFLRSKAAQEQDLEDEMRLHRELRARQLTQEGIEERDASHEAVRRFGNETLLKEKANDMWGWTWLDDLRMDLRHTGRMLAGNPGFTAVAILTLALGIGANSAIFSVTNALLLKSLPVREPKQLFHVRCDRQPDGAGDTGDPASSFSYYVFEHLRNDKSAASDLMAYVPMGFGKVSMRTGQTAEEGAGDMVSGNFFEGLGVPAACGRLLSDPDEAAHTSAAVVSYGFAARRFGDACSAVDKQVFIKGLPFTIVGVTARAFTGVEAMPTDVWIPLQLRPEMNAWGSSEEYYRESPNWWCLLMMARLKPGMDRASAEAALNPGFQRAAYEPLGGKPKPGEHTTRLHLVQARGDVGAEGLKKPLLTLQTMVGLLLLIACGNVGMLLAVRNVARAREFSVRLALGGSKGRLIRQLLAESVVLVGCGAVVGLLFAVVAVRALARWADMETSLAPDSTVLLFTVAVSIGAALLFGLIPALGAGRVKVAQALKTSAATAYRDRARVATGNVTAAIQLALCLTLLVATGLLVRTLQNLVNVDLGFKTEGLLVFGVNPPPQAQAPQRQAPQGDGTTEQTVAFYRGLLDQLRRVPGVRHVTLMGNRVASGWSNNTNAIVNGGAPKDVQNDMMRWNNVGPDFFATLDVPMIEGRDFSDSDTGKSAPVAIVNRTMMHKFFKDRSPLGHTVSFNTQKAYTIVGVAEDSKYTGVEEKPIPMAWFPYTQVDFFGAMHVEMRTSGSAAALLQVVQQTVAKFEPNTALLQPRTQQEEFGRTIATERLLARLSATFAVLATILVAIGLYGTLAFSVTRRTSELGLRLALGAERQQVLWMILRGGLVLGAVGLVIGIPMVIGATRLLGSLLYGVAPMDPMSIALAAAAILAVAAVATYFPARRAAHVDPMVALRYE